MNRKSILVLLIFGTIALLALAACSGGSSAGTGEQTVDEHEEDAEDADEHDDDAEHEDEDEHSDEGENADEHVGDAEHEDEHAHVDPPAEFADLTNPLAGDAEAIEAGETIFQASCATCHGESGEGDGPAAAGLDPAPASLADTDMMADLSDGYLFWRISKGGAMEPFNSAMIAWEDTLSEDEIWQVVSYVRSLSQ